MNAPLYSSEYVDGAWDVIIRHLVPRLWAGPLTTGADVGPALRAVKGHPMAKAALELAVLDAELKRSGTSLASFLGAERRVVPAGVAVGVSGSIDDLLENVGRYVEAGYRRVKLKIGPGWDVEPVRAVRDRFGPTLALQVDANGSYAVGDARRLAELDRFDLLLIEQPLAEDDLLGAAELARQIRTPLCLDESITSAASTELALALGACSVVNIKPGRVGGILEARRIHDLCAARGVPVWCGGMLETGIGRAVNVALAALPGFTIPGDLSASDRYFAPDITEPFVLEDGCLRVPTGPGIGVTVDIDRVEALTTARTLLPRV